MKESKRILKASDNSNKLKYISTDELKEIIKKFEKKCFLNATEATIACEIELLQKEGVL